MGDHTDYESDEYEEYNNRNNNNQNRRCKPRYNPRNIVCYHCNEFGHKQYNCPNKVSPPYDEIHVYTDGACLRNPGPGGYGVVIKFMKNNRIIQEEVVSGGEPQTTSNRMELTAVIEALQALPNEYNTDIVIATDSMYVKEGITSWINNWKRNGWRTYNNQQVQNIDLWMSLDDITNNKNIYWNWIRGHSGDPDNEYADFIANSEARKMDQENQPSYQILGTMNELETPPHLLISPDNFSGLTTIVNIHGFRTEVVVSTANYMNFMNYNYFQKYLEPEGVELYKSSNPESRAVGFASVEISLNNKKTTHRFVVYKGLIVNVIFGNEFLKCVGAKMSFNRGVNIIVDGQQITGSCNGYNHIRDIIHATDIN